MKTMAIPVRYTNSYTQEVCDGAYERKIENVDECDIAGYYNDITNVIYT